MLSLNPSPTSWCLKILVLSAFLAAQSGLFSCSVQHPAALHLDIVQTVLTCEGKLPPNRLFWLGKNSSEVRFLVEFLRIYGFPVQIQWTTAGPRRTASDPYPALIWLACPAAHLTGAVMEQLENMVRHGSTLVVFRDYYDARLDTLLGARPEPGTRTIQQVTFYDATGPTWITIPTRTHHATPLVPGPDTRPLAYTEPKPHAGILITARTVGRGTAILLGYSLREMSQKPPDGLYAMVYHLASQAAPVALVAPLRYTAILRMDDPQSSSKIWNHDVPDRYLTRYPTLSPQDWETIHRILTALRARMSVMYVSGYIDDGNDRDGTLLYKGAPVFQRKCGTIYDIKDVRYRTRGENPILFDFETEYRALARIHQKGSIDIESHGFLHTTPFLQEWCADPQRARHYLWMSEFFDLFKRRPVPIAIQEDRLRNSIQRITAWFGTAPTTFSPPMHAYSGTTPLLARTLNFSLLHAQTLYDLTRSPILEFTHIPVFWGHLGIPRDPHLDRSGYPIVIGLHDWDLYKHGPYTTWLPNYIRLFQKRGYRNITTFRYLAGYLGARVRGTYTAHHGEAKLTIHIDISRTGGMGGPESREFSHQPMEWILFTSRNTVTHVSDGNRSIPYTELRRGQYRIRVPPFGDAAAKKIVVTLR